LHFVALTSSSNQFAGGLSTIIAHPAPAKDRTEALRSVSRLCKPNLFPWEHQDSQMFNRSHIEKFGTIFSGAVDKHLVTHYPDGLDSMLEVSLFDYVVSGNSLSLL
jgi:hypothetical protein